MVGPVTVGPVAHGGHCVARLDGRVIFVRHALPGEEVRLRLTDTSRERFWRADAVEILRPSPDRVVPRCVVARPGGCGGCDLQHVSAAGQISWKTAVVREQLDHLAGYGWDGQVQAVEPLWQWRTRMRYVRADDGRLAMRRFHSHELVELPSTGCAIATDPTLITIEDAHSGTEEVLGPDVITEHAAGRRWTVSSGGFWQVHPAAADLLVATVLEGLDPRSGERAFDLYCGVGLFAGALADRGVQVWGVEYDRRAIEHARANLADHAATTRFTAGDVARQLMRMPKRTDLVVLDPPRKGAGRKVIEAVIGRRPRKVALVACDPAALGRDVGSFLTRGWQVERLDAFDLFPQTHHIEAVAIVAPPGA